jgi:hypothetical protein
LAADAARHFSRTRRFCIRRLLSKEHENIASIRMRGSRVKLQFRSFARSEALAISPPKAHPAIAVLAE